jgi:hypothetical protein
MYGQHPMGGAPAPQQNQPPTVDLDDLRPACEVFELPQEALREPELPPRTGPLKTHEVYKLVGAIGQALEQPDGEANVRRAMASESEIALALHQALLEAGMLVDADAAANGASGANNGLPLHPIPTPQQPAQLPPHMNTWLGTRKAAAAPAPGGAP